ncbi:hypothetical protein CCACVL1_23222 [Corchorus capsularis]|uniref:Uncharacterized protein n=1 Tax=Corchorus capsularis TaxID=210143 RepID=A0A1R3GUS1_COCAP|nr:hypothetical protein CCACVL1_23222 [Corchorus capsularis]
MGWIKLAKPTSLSDVEKRLNELHIMAHPIIDDNPDILVASTSFHSLGSESMLCLIKLAKTTSPSDVEKLLNELHIMTHLGIVDCRPNVAHIKAGKNEVGDSSLSIICP